MTAGDDTGGAISDGDVPAQATIFGWIAEVVDQGVRPGYEADEWAEQWCADRFREPSTADGAAAFIGVLADYPGDSYEYYVPYDAVERPLPGVWIRGSDGAQLRDLMAAGPVRVQLTVATDVGTVESYNVVGDLPGADGVTAAPPGACPRRPCARRPPGWTPGGLARP